MNELKSHPRYEEALRHARELRSFYSHALIYVLVISGLAVLNYFTSPGRLWFVFPMLGWGLGVLFHGLSVLAVPGLFGTDWEERKVREYLDRRR